MISTVVARLISQKISKVPMCKTWHNLCLNVLLDLRPLFAFLRWSIGQQLLEIPGLHIGHDTAILHGVVVLGNCTCISTIANRNTGGWGWLL